ncbi:hypothetical protein D3C74_160080 [compost metagenome]
MKIKIVRRNIPNHPFLGSIHEARRLNRNGLPIDLAPNYQITDGSYSGLILPYESVQEVTGERTFTQNEVNDILQQRDKMIDELAKHAQTIVDMQNELNAARRKVELPKEVAEAIESYRHEGHDNDYIIKCLTRNTRDTAFKRLGTLFSYCDQNGHLLISALVNGYTVEQTPEERLQEKLEGLIMEWYEAPGTDDGIEADVRWLATQIVAQAKELITT